MTTRNDIADIFRRVDPEGDYDNDDVFYSKILADYSDYARLLTAEAEAQKLEAQKAAEAAIQPSMAESDGLPHLAGGDIGVGSRSNSIFDIAAGA